jgi:DHA1 family bicyclomycin/chloramphenicol resistance-like MFS transporter
LQRTAPAAALSIICPVRKTAPIWLLVLITLSGTMAMHMFVPALPYAGTELGASVGEMQMTISVYIVGLAVGQLFYGPVSDALGRRPMLMMGLALYAAGGLVAALAPQVRLLVAARLVQALGGCAGLALGRAIVRDTVQSDKAVRQLALMNLMTMMGPGLAPVAGAAIAATLGWRAIFWALAAFGAVTLVLTWRLLPETGSPAGRFSAGRVLQDYRALLRSRAFQGFAFGGACTTTSIYAFIAAAPFIFTRELHRPLHEVGIYLGVLMLGMALGNLLTGRLIRRLPMQRLLLVGNGLSVASAGVLLLTIALGHLSVATTLALMFGFTCGAGMASPAALTRSISVDPQRIGSAAGLYGFAQMAIGAICTSFASVGDNPALTAAAVLLVATALGQVAFWIAIASERGDKPLPAAP